MLAAPGVARDVDLVALEQYLTFDYVIGPRTMLAGTSKLPGGHYAEITAQDCRYTSTGALPPTRRRCRDAGLRESHDLGGPPLSLTNFSTKPFGAGSCRMCPSAFF